MSFKVTIAAPGLSQVQDALRRLPDKLSNKIVRAAMLKAVQPVLTAVKLHAPKDSGLLQKMQVKSGSIRGGNILIRVGARYLSKTQISRNIAKRRKSKRSKAAIENAYYDRFLEYGTVNMPAQPYLRPAFDSKKEEFVAILVVEINYRLEEAYKKFPNYRP